MVKGAHRQKCARPYGCTVERARVPEAAWSGGRVPCVLLRDALCGGSCLQPQLRQTRIDQQNGRVRALSGFTTLLLLYY